MREQIREIWGEVLGVDASDIHDSADFFVLGGDSVQVLEMLAAVERATGRPASLESFFTEPTFMHLCGVLNADD